MKCVCPTGGDRTCPGDCPLAVWATLSLTDRKAQRKPIAEKLYKQGFTMEAIATQLGVTHATISYDLKEFVSDLQIKKPTKTDANPKGAGRPKGSKSKPRAESAPQAVKREERVAVLMDAGKTAHEIAADLGVVVRAANQAMEHVKIKREAEAIIDPATLSLSAQEKLASATRQHARKLDAAFERRVSDDLRRRLDEIILPHWKQQIEEAKRIYERRKGIMDKATFNRIRRALHPDSRNSISDKVLSDAFDTFMGLEKFLLDEKDSPTDFADVPNTLAEWDAMKQKAGVERRTNRNHSANIAQRR